MSDTVLLIVLAVAAVLASAIYYFAWIWTAKSSRLIQTVVRLGIPAAVLVTAAIGVLTPTLQQAEKTAAPNDLRRFEYRMERPKPKVAKKSMKPGATDDAKPKADKDARRAARRARERAEASRRASSEYEDRARRDAEAAAMEEAQKRALQEMTGASDVQLGNAPEALTEAAPPEPPMSGAAPPAPAATTTAPLAPPAPAAPPPPPPPPAATTAAPAAKDETADWDLVPVFYGTDRKRADNANRLDYDGNRGRRLELGHALVSVPKLHQVPNIERPWAVRIPYFNVTIYEEAEDPKKHFVMQEIKALSRQDFMTLVRDRLANSKTFKDQAFVFVHGFNTSFENGVYRTAQIAYDLKFDGAPFLYSWPSGGAVSSYTYDRESSGQSTPYMRDFMKLVLNETGAKAVSVIAHSMGNQPILQVLRDLKRSTPDDVVISQIILAAPDVDRDNFENIAKEILGLAKGVTLYVAANDQALQFSRSFHGGVPRAGDVPSQGPVVINGIDTIDVTAASTDSLGINHSGYAENNALLKDIGRLIATGAPPSERQPPKFERIDQGQGTYWKFPEAN